MLFEAIFKELDRRQIRYLVIGGIAVNLHGFARATGDLDIMLWLEEGNLEKFVAMVKFLKMKPRAPVPLESFLDLQQRNKWIKEKGMKVFSVYNPKKEIEHIDIMLENYISFDRAYQNREVVSAVGIKISVLSIPDLIKLKKIAGRERDKIDIQALKQIMEIKNEKKKT